MVGHPEIHPEYLERWVDHTALNQVSSVQIHFPLHMHVLIHPLINNPFLLYLKAYLIHAIYITYHSKRIYRLQYVYQIYRTSINPILSKTMMYSQ